MDCKRGFLESFFKALNDYNINYAVMRNYENLPYSVGGSDIDIWVEEKDCQLFFDITGKISKQYKGYLVSYIWKRCNPRICILSSCFGVQFDVHKGTVPIGNYVLYPPELYSKHIELYNNVKVINKDFCALDSFLKEVLNTGSCDRKASFYSDLSNTLKIISFERLREWLPMFSDEFLKQLYRVSSEEKSSALIRYIYTQGNKELKERVSGSSFDSIRKFGRMFHRPGYMIAILGTDGSGKSAIYNGINGHLENAFHNKLYYRHLRPHLLPDIAVLLGKRDKADAPEVCENPHAAKSSGFIMSMVRLMYYLQDYIWGFFLRIWPLISTQSSVFIIDRYYYDYYIDQTRSKTNLPLWFIRFFDFFVPSPDIILCLGGDPKRIFERKPETSLEEVTRQTDELRKFCEHRSNAFWVDTTENDLDTSVKNALDGIAKMMSKRFEYVTKL